MIEIIRSRSDIYPRAVLFDFDGTLSLIRSGWQRIMRIMMLEILLPTAQDEAPEVIAESITHAIDQRTGHPTIAQMEWLCAELKRHGGRPDSPDSYKRRYRALLNAQVDQRCDALRAGDLSADALLVPGARALLEGLRERGLLLILASGTDHADVLREAHALELADYFGPHIYGPGPQAPDFSKRAVIARLLAEENVSGPQLVALGDGSVEIAETHAVDGLAVGVAFDEQRGAGLDLGKRTRLIQAGADLIVADFHAHAQLIEYLLDAAIATCRMSDHADPCGMAF